MMWRLVFSKRNPICDVDAIRYEFYQSVMCEKEPLLHFLPHARSAICDHENVEIKRRRIFGIGICIETDTNLNPASATAAADIANIFQFQPSLNSSSLSPSLSFFLSFYPLSLSSYISVYTPLSFSISLLKPRSLYLYLYPLSIFCLYLSLSLSLFLPFPITLSCFLSLFVPLSKHPYALTISTSLPNVIAELFLFIYLYSLSH